jgi:hypothetical protein
MAVCGGVLTMKKGIAPALDHRFEWSCMPFYIVIAGDPRDEEL